MLKTRGFTLIELCVSLLISAILLAGLMTAMSYFNSGNDELKKRSKLRNSLYDAGQIMTADIQRAGYWNSQNESALTKTNVNPYMDPNKNGIPTDSGYVYAFSKPSVGRELPYNIRTSTPTVNGITREADCILLAYDTDQAAISSSASTIPDKDRYGYRVNFINNIGVIQERGSGTFNCIASSGDNWNNLTDPKQVDIIQLWIRDNTSIVVESPDGKATVSARVIQMIIKGCLTGNQAICEQVNLFVKVQNDVTHHVCHVGDACPAGYPIEP